MLEVRRFLAKLGTPDVAAAAEALRSTGAEGGAAFLRSLARGLGGKRALGAPGANGRAVMEDLESALIALARAHPDVFLRGTAAEPLASSFAVVSALRVVRDAEAADRLGALLSSKSGAVRWLAATELIARREARLVARLGKLLRDRDGLVVFVAAEACSEHGTPAERGALTAIAESPRTPPGTKKAAVDALAAIDQRAQAAR